MHPQIFFYDFLLFHEILILYASLFPFVIFWFWTHFWSDCWHALHSRPKNLCKFKYQPQKKSKMNAVVVVSKFALCQSLCLRHCQPVFFLKLNVGVCNFLPLGWIAAAMNILTQLGSGIADRQCDCPAMAKQAASC
jgi:hypothetical protein